MHRRQQQLIPAPVLCLHEARQPFTQPVQPFLWGQPTLIQRLRLVVPILNPLQHTRNPDLHELIQIACRNRQKLHPLQQRVRRVLGLFQNPLIESQPGLIPAKKQVFNSFRRVLLALDAFVRTSLRRRSSRLFFSSHRGLRAYRTLVITQFERPANIVCRKKIQPKLNKT